MSHVVPLTPWLDESVLIVSPAKPQGLVWFTHPKHGDRRDVFHSFCRWLKTATPFDLGEASRSADARPFAAQGGAKSPVPMSARILAIRADDPYGCICEWRGVRRLPHRRPGIRARRGWTSASPRDVCPERHAVEPRRSGLPHWTKPKIRRSPLGLRAPDSIPRSGERPTGARRPVDTSRTDLAKRGRLTDARRSSRRHTVRARA